MDKVTSYQQRFGTLRRFRRPFVNPLITFQISTRDSMLAFDGSFSTKVV